LKTFADILSGKQPVARVWEDGAHLAFLAAQPVRAGHTILTTKRIAPYVFELGAEEQRALWAAAAEVAALLKRNLPCERVCVAVVGWEVRHVHVHLVPTDKPGEFPPLGGAAASADELEWIAQRIRTGRDPVC
jgi:histidine triad (HIT) family protein